MSTSEMASTLNPSLARVAEYAEHSDGHDRHVVQFYGADESLLDSLSRSVGAALGSGSVAVVIATAEHRDGLARRLRAQGLDPNRASKQGRYIPLDAAETLSRFMRAGNPDETLFNEAIGAVMESALAAAPDGARRVLTFGEMVALLWAQGMTEAAIRLEQLWNGLEEKYTFSLHCAYPISGFQHVHDDKLFMRICAEHTGVIPAESYTRLASEEERLRSVASLQQQALVLERLSKAYEELHESEQRYRLLVDCVKDYAIFMLGPKGHVMSWNQGAQRINGYAREEILGRHFSVFYQPEDVQAGKPRRELEIAMEEGRFEDEGWCVRKDGSRFWANVIITAQHSPDGELRGFTKVTRDITERKKAEDAMRELSGRLLRAQDEAKRRLARELHDSAAQTLAALGLNLALLETYPEVAGHPRAGKALAESAALVDEAAREIRTFSYLLHPPALDGTCLGSALRWFTDGFSQRTKIQVEFEVSPGLERLPEELEATLFRVAQEALTNVYRHSGSQKAGVRLGLNDGELTLEVRDNGRGFPAEMLEDGERGPARLGVGIRGMRERLQQLGGRLVIRNTGAGACVSAIVPVKTPALA